MADLELTAAVEAAAREQWTRMTRTTTTFEQLSPIDQHAIRSMVAPIINDAANLIAAVGYNEGWVDGAVAQHDIPEQRLLAALDLDDKRHNPYRQGATT